MRPLAMRAWFQKLADSLLPTNPDQATQTSETAAATEAGIYV